MDQPLKTILTALGQMVGKTIVVDETVTGNATHYFKNKSFDDVLKVILSTNRLYASTDGDVIVISRIQAKALADGSLSIDADQVSLEVILRRLARAAEFTILYEPLPDIQMDLHVKSASLAGILDAIMQRIPGYTLQKKDNAYFIKAVPVVASVGAKSDSSATGFTLTQDPTGTYSVQGKSVRFTDLIEKLFTLGKKEFNLLKRSDAMIDRINFEHKDFDTLLRLILDLADGDFVVRDDVYVLLEANRNDIVKKYDVVEGVQLRNASANQVLSLIPASLLGGNTIKVDKQSNTLLMSGSQAELDALKAFIKKMDAVPAGMGYYRFDLKYVAADTLPSILPDTYKGIADPIILKSQNAVLLLLSPELSQSVSSFIALADRPKTPQILKLKYIKADDFLAKLPAFVSKDSVSIGPDQRYVFFSGSPELFHQLENQMAYIDLPTPQIKYQVLIIQYTRDHTLDWSPPSISIDGSTKSSDFKGIDLKDGNFLGLSALFGSAGASISSNLLAAFGLNFATSLKAKLVEKYASILADTTVNALSNQDVSFRNTNTSRYKDTVTSSSGSSSTSTQVIREIESGLVVTLKGWVSGDGMITMTISTSFKQQASSPSGSSSTDAALPSTFEKVFSTSVRARSGEPIVLGGLVSSESSASNSGTPGLTYLTGPERALSTTSDTNTQTELMIYIIPHIENTVLLGDSIVDVMNYLYDAYALKTGGQESGK